jgi:hypothetical protein
MMTDDKQLSNLSFPGALKDYLRESRELFQGSPEACSDVCAEEYAMLEDADRLLSDSIRDLNLRGDVIGNLLGVSGYMLWLAAIRNAMSGHAAAVFPLLRTSLESICYWARIETDPSLTAIWLERHNDERARKKSRKVFTSAVKDVADVFGTSPPEALGAHILELYDSLIDFGAHPNPRGMFVGVSLGGGAEKSVVSFVALESLSGTSVRRAMLACVECGAFMAAVVRCLPIAKKEAADVELEPVLAILSRTNAYAIKSHEQK